MKKQRSKIATITISSIVCAIALGCGVGLGFMFGKTYLEGEVDYASIDPLELEDNQNVLMSRYKKNKDNLNKFEPYELVNIALNKFDSLDQHAIELDGWVHTSLADQTIVGKTIKDGTRMFNESISLNSTLSAFNVYKRFYQEGETVNEYSKGNDKDLWSANGPKPYTLPEYEEAYGKTLDRSSIYVVSSKTVLSSTLATDENDHYVVTIELDPIPAAIRYVRQMKSISNLDGFPRFDLIKMTVQLDKDINILSRKVEENYTVKMYGLPVDSTSEITENYFLDGRNIPSLDAN